MTANNTRELNCAEAMPGSVGRGTSSGCTLKEIKARIDAYARKRGMIHPRRRRDRIPVPAFDYNAIAFEQTSFLEATQ